MEDENYDNRRRKQVESIINSEHMTRIFFLIIDGIDYTEEIAKRFGTSPKSMTINIRKMREARIIKRKPKFGVKQRYEPDWLGIAEILRKHWKPSIVTLGDWDEKQVKIKATRSLSPRVNDIDKGLQRYSSKSGNNLQNLYEKFDAALAKVLLIPFFIDWRKNELEWNKDSGKTLGYDEAQIEKLRIAPLGGFGYFTLGDIINIFDRGISEILGKKAIKKLKLLSKKDESDDAILWKALIALYSYYESTPQPDPEPWDGVVAAAFNKRAKQIMRKTKK